MFTIDELATIPLFSDLEEKALEYLAGEVEDIHLTPGEYVAYEGEGRALAIVFEGKTELTKLVNGVEQVIGVRFPGELGGEVPMTLGTPLPASMRAVEPSRVLKVTVEVFHTLAAMAPQVSTAVGAAALERIEMLKNATAQPLEPSMFVIGPRLDPGVHSCDSFLHRNQIPYERLDPDDPRAIARTGGESAVAAPYPVVSLRDGTQLIAPTMRAVATVSGLTVAPGRPRYDVVIVGGGPAGLTAAVNGASEGLETGLIESFAPGGQAGTSTRIENYTGFPYGVSGDELASRALQQAKRLGAEIVVTRRVERIDPVDMTVTLDGGDVLRTRSIILAMGVEWRRLEIDSVERFVGSGVYYGAARSDASLAQGNDVYLDRRRQFCRAGRHLLLQPRPIGDAPRAGRVAGREHVYTTSSSRSQRKRTSGWRHDPRSSRCTETNNSRRSRSSIEGQARHLDETRECSSSSSAPKRRPTGFPQRSRATKTDSS